MSIGVSTRVASSLPGCLTLLPCSSLPLTLPPKPEHVAAVKRRESANARTRHRQHATSDQTVDAPL